MAWVQGKTLLIVREGLASTMGSLWETVGVMLSRPLINIYILRGLIATFDIQRPDRQPASLIWSS